MRVAIISDIHGNLEALNSVYNDISRSKIDKIICLGDIIGYGAEPSETIDFIIKNKIESIIGNHELALLNPNKMKTFNRYAKEAIILTKKQLNKKQIDYISKLPVNLKFNGSLFVHGFPPDQVGEYIYLKNNDELIKAFNLIKSQICFVGHTHEQKIYSYDGNKVIKRYLLEGKRVIDKKLKHIINVGSVGQPRDSNNNAKYIIFDTKSFELEIKSIKYNPKKTYDIMIKRGFPEFNAKRLVD
ncbi:metallophosphoesterase family protein [archaeon]|jgi:predicted phosphodiesterase|nr:metallophosphoesterase family protein [archaeon]